jgi:hypothetical protein
VLQLQLPGLQQTHACITGPLRMLLLLLLLLILLLQLRGPTLLLLSSSSRSTGVSCEAQPTPL